MKVLKEERVEFGCHAGFLGLAHGLELLYCIL